MFQILWTSDLHGIKIHSHIDLIKVYHQIPIHQDGIYKSAIIISFGLFGFTRIQFGLWNTVSTFKLFMDISKRDSTFAYIFVDDILIASRKSEEHLEHMIILFECLKIYWLSLKPSKCIFGISYIEFLDLEVPGFGNELLPDRVDCILKFPQPTTVTQLRFFS